MAMCTVPAVITTIDQPARGVEFYRGRSEIQRFGLAFDIHQGLQSNE